MRGAVSGRRRIAWAGSAGVRDVRERAHAADPVSGVRPAASTLTSTRPSWSILTVTSPPVLAGDPGEVDGGALGDAKARRLLLIAQQGGADAQGLGAVAAVLARLAAGVAVVRRAVEGGDDRAREFGGVERRALAHDGECGVGPRVLLPGEGEVGLDVRLALGAGGVAQG